MARTPSRLAAPPVMMASMEQVSGNLADATTASLAASAAIYAAKAPPNPKTDRNQIAQAWQIEAYRHVNICGEARYAATLFAALAGRAEIGISEPQAMIRKPVWVTSGKEVDALAILCPDVRARTKLVRDYMLHRTIAGECYLIARKRVDTDPGYIAPPLDEHGQVQTWEQVTRRSLDEADMLDPDFDIDEIDEDPNEPIWEIVGVTEIRKMGLNEWQVRHDNNEWLDLSPEDPVIRLWNQDPENRREAWSPFRSLLPTLREIEWLTAHIFTQVRSRLMSAGVWFLPENLTFPPPPPDSVEGGAETIAMLNEAQQFMLSLAASGTYSLEANEVSFPTVVMTDPAALDSITQDRLIKFWSEIDDAAMTLRSDAIRRFALGFDMPPEQTLGSSGIAVSGTSGSAGSVNHWGVWANEEQAISTHIEPALDDFVGTLTVAFLRTLVPKTQKVIAYGTEAMRLRQDRSKEALQWYDRGVLKATVALRESGFDPESDIMDDQEFRKWLLMKMVGGSPTPEQVQAAVTLLGVVLPVAELPPGGSGSDGQGRPGRHEAPNTDPIEVQGPPEGDHEHHEAPYSALHASCEVLVLRALEKKGNMLLNSGKRGKDRDRTTPPHTAHIGTALDHTYSGSEFDFGLASTVLEGLAPGGFDGIEAKMGRFCADLYNSGSEYTREALIEALS